MTWVLVIVVVVLLVVVGLLLYRQRQSAQLREGFGPEYDRALDEHGDQRAAEAELRERRERRRSYDIKPLEESARERYVERWKATQAKFVDQPASALTDADELVAEVMRERGYPVEDFDQQAADVSVDHPHVVENYREAHAIHSTRDASTEDLRQAMVHYRALFAELLEAPKNHEVQEVR